MSGKLGNNLDAALRLWSLDGDRDLATRAAASLGTLETVALWPRLRDHASQLPAYEQARRLLQHVDPRPAPDAIGALGDRLAATPAQDGVEKLAALTQPWHATAPWRQDKNGTWHVTDAADQALDSAPFVVDDQGSTLTFEIARYSSNYDHAYVQVSADGGTSWTEARSFYNTSGTQQAEVDLAPWLGRSVQVRFTAGAGSTTLSKLKLGAQPFAEVVGDPVLEALIKVATGPAADGVKRLDAMTESLGSLQAATRLYPLVPDVRDQDGIVKMVQEFGVNEAQALWPVLNQGPQSERETRYGYMQLAREVLLNLSERPAVADLQALYGKLLATPPDADTASVLRQLGKSARAWQGEGWTQDRNGTWQAANGGDKALQSACFVVDDQATALTFSLRHYSSNYDYLQAQLTPDGGKTWVNVASYNNTSGDQACTIDLSPWRGKSVALRFRPGSGTTSLSYLKIGRQPFAEYVGAPVVDRVVTALTTGDRKQHAAQLQALAGELGSLQAATRLHPLIEDKPDYDRRHDLMVKLATTFGINEARDLWPVLDKGGDYTLLETAREVLLNLGARPPTAKILEVYHKLAASPPDAATSASLRELAAQTRAWSGEPWMQDSRGAWSLGNAADQPLTSAAFVVDDGAADLTFKLARYSSSYDYAKTEVSTDNGKTWTSLASYSNTSGDQACKVDLSPYLGRSVRVRFTPGAGRSTLKDLELGGKPFADVVGEPVVDSVVDLLEQPSRADNAAHLKQLSDELGSLEAATRLYPLIQADYTGRHDALVKLAQEFGINEARTLWPVLDAGDAAGREERYKLLQTAREVLLNLSARPPAAKMQAIYEQLLAHPPDTDALKALADQTRPLRGDVWSQDRNGTWSIRHAADQPLTSAAFVVDDQATSLSMNLSRYSSSYDYGNAEISTDDGKTWTTARSISNTSGAQQETIDLSPYRGRSIRFRFRPGVGNSSLTQVQLGGKSFADYIGEPVLDAVVKALTAPQARDNATRLAQLSAELGSLEAATRIHPLISGNYDKQHDMMVKLAQEFGINEAVALWPALDPARYDVLQSARNLWLNVESRPAASKIQDVYQRLCAAGPDAPLLSAAEKLAAASRTWTGDAWQSDANGTMSIKNAANQQLLSLPFIVPDDASSLGFDVTRYSSSYDPAYVEVSPDGGKTWTRQSSIYNTSGQQHIDVDLSGWRGRVVQVRIAPGTGSTTIAAPTLGGTPFEQAVVGPVIESIVRRAADATRSLDARKQTLSRLQALSDRVGVQAATQLFPLLGDTPDYDKQCAALLPLADEFGAGAMTLLWPELNHGEASRVDLLRSARSLAETTMARPPAQTILSLYKRLAASPPAPAVTQALQAVTDRGRLWEGSAGTTLTLQANGGVSIQHAAYQTFTLTSQPFSLASYRNCRFSAAACTGGTVALQGSFDGKTWENLSQTADGTYALQHMDGKAMQLRLSAYSSGTTSTLGGMTLHGEEKTSGHSVSLPLDNLTAAPFIDGLMIVATEPRVSPDEIVKNLDFLAHAPSGWTPRMLQFLRDNQAALPGRQLSQVIGKLSGLMVLKQDLEPVDASFLTLLDAGQGAPQGIEADDDHVTIGGVQLDA
ncbi:MAG: hypothetical protein ACYCW6_05300 [Candidatus Xenobia bacterium]